MPTNSPYREDSDMRQQGVVKSWRSDRGFGFIQPDGGGSDIFVHYTALPKRGNSKRDLSKGQRVEYSVENTAKGVSASDLAVL